MGVIWLGGIKSLAFICSSCARFGVVRRGVFGDTRIHTGNLVFDHILAWVYKSMFPLVEPHLQHERFILFDTIARSYIESVLVNRLDEILPVGGFQRGHEKVDRIEFGGFPFERIRPGLFGQRPRLARFVAPHAQKRRRENEPVRIVLKHSLVDFFHDIRRRFEYGLGVARSYRIRCCETGFLAVFRDGFTHLYREEFLVDDPYGQDFVGQYRLQLHIIDGLFHEEIPGNCLRNACRLLFFLRKRRGDKRIGPFVLLIEKVEVERHE